MFNRVLLTGHHRLIFVFLLLLGTLTSAVAAEVISGFDVTYGGRVFDSATNRTTFTYTVTGTGVPPDLSHFDIEIPHCVTPLIVVAYNPSSATSFGVDPTTGIDGIKWDTPLQMNASRTYSISFEGNVAEGTVRVAVKGGNGFEIANLPGPSCDFPRLDLEKFVSVDGVTWQDADAAPGPIVSSGTQVSFRFVVTNTGTVDLTNLSLTDSMFAIPDCAIPPLLPPGAFFECRVGPQLTVDGQHSNTASAIGVANNIVVNDTDLAHYFSGTVTPIPTPSPTAAASATPEVTLTPGATAIPSTPTASPTATSGNLPITIVIEGPVQAININIITIFNINIVLGENDPILNIIQIGDVLRVEGDTQELNGAVVIIAINIIVLNVEINVDTGEYWRDDGGCGNPPPAWAPANGWRRRCGNAGDVTIIIQPGAPFVIPEGCKLTGFGNGNIRLKCSKRTDR